MKSYEEGETTPGLTLLIPREDIAAAVARLARELDRAYAPRPPVLVGVLKGSFIFLADLVRQMSIPIHRLEFIPASSYGSDRTSSGEPEVGTGLTEESVGGRDVLVVEDIVDTGLTTAAVLERLRGLQPASVRVCVLLDKPSRRRQAVPIDHVGFTIPDLFVVGYGLDFDQRYRELPDLHILAP